MSEYRLDPNRPIDVEEVLRDLESYRAAEAGLDMAQTRKRPEDGAV